MTKTEAVIGIVQDMKKSITLVLIGVGRGDLAFELAKKCSNIKKMYLIDTWRGNFERSEAYNYVNRESQIYNDKIEVQDFSNNDIKDESADLIFVDTDYFSEDINIVVEKWQSKNKKDGLFLSTRDLMGQENHINAVANPQTEVSNINKSIVNPLAPGNRGVQDISKLQSKSTISPTPSTSKKVTKEVKEENLAINAKPEAVAPKPEKSSIFKNFGKNK